MFVRPEALYLVPDKDASAEGANYCAKQKHHQDANDDFEFDFVHNLITPSSSQDLYQRIADRIAEKLTDDLSFRTEPGIKDIGR